MNYLQEMTDEDLALRYVDGDNRAFDELLSRNQSKLFSYILFVVRDREIADDIFQETFVKVICKLQEKKYTTSGKFSAWLIRIAHNIIMDRYRLQKTEKIVEPTSDNDLSNLYAQQALTSNIENYYVYQQTLNEVKQIMNLLPAPQREVVFMRYYQDLSFKEIAELTNVSINTALGRMRYALLNMRRMAKEHNIALMID
uniref:Sigma-70 family RNA polymerase sigma factor n=2 Tax=unclassified Prevotella TaxID=2638335 RepID=A0AB33JHT1_9BACT